MFHGIGLLALRPTAVGRYLRGLRAHLSPPIPSDAIVVVAVLGSSLRKHGKKVAIPLSAFRSICGEVFREKGGQTPDETRVKMVEYSSCAWFPKGNPSAAVRAAVALRSKYLTNEPRDPRPILLSVAQDEGCASKLLWLAGDNQGVVAPEIWKRLEDIERTIASDAGIHDPKVDVLSELLKKAMGGVTRRAPLQPLSRSTEAKKESRSSIRVVR